jgi:serine/threonine protein kinase
MSLASLGPFQIVRRLGRGGMAEVHLAVAHGASGFERRVALKTLLPGLADEPEPLRALVHEARVAGRLAHRNLVAVLGLGVDEGVTYVVMEYVDGGDLATLLAAAGGPMPAPLALLCAEELALGLDVLHRAVDDRGLPLGLVHRDVSPSNVLVSRAGEVKLGDFGIAKATALADLTGGTRKGKYAYMSPEQLVGEPLGPASDQFALGVVLAELLTGARPFEADTPLATMERVRSGPRPQLGGFGEAIAAIVARALAPAPSERFASVEAMRRAIALARRELPAVSLPDLAAWVQGAQAPSKPT